MYANHAKQKTKGWNSIQPKPRRRNLTSKQKTKIRRTFFEAQFVKFRTLVVVKSFDGNARFSVIDQGFVGIFVPFFLLEWVAFRSVCRSVADVCTFSTSVVLIGIAVVADRTSARTFAARVAAAATQSRCHGSNRTAFGIFRAPFASLIQTRLGRSGFLPPNKQTNKQ